MALENSQPRLSEQLLRRLRDVVTRQGAVNGGIKNGIPSGKHTKNYGKIHHFQWENPLFLWPFSIAILT